MSPCGSSSSSCLVVTYRPESPNEFLFLFSSSSPATLLLIPSTFIVGDGLGLGQRGPQWRVIAHNSIDEAFVAGDTLFRPFVAGSVSRASDNLGANGCGEADEFVPTFRASRMVSPVGGGGGGDETRGRVNPLLAVTLEIVQLITAGLQWRLWCH